MSLLLKRLLKYFLYGVSVAFILTIGPTVYLIWFQPPFYFPKPTGQYAVGVKTYHWVNTSRKETFANDPVHPNRELMVNVWYPTTLKLRRTSPAQGTLAARPSTPYARYLADYYKENKKTNLACILVSRQIYSYAQLNATLATDVSQFPIIIFSHNYGGASDSNTAQCEELASHGYAVVGISHPYANGIIQFSDGRIADGIIAVEKRFQGANSIKTHKLLDQEIETWISDVQFVLDQLEQLTNDKASIFYQRFDQKNIGIFGHSMGGGTAAQICRRDPRIKAGVALEGVFFGNDATTGFDTPFMFMLAGNLVKMYERPWTHDDWKKFGICSLDEEKSFRATYLPTVKQLVQSRKHDMYAFVVQGAGHMFFSDAALLKQASIFSRFLDCFEDTRIGSDVGPINGFRATEIVNAYLLNFFDKYLKGKPSELLDGGGKKYVEVEIRQ